MKRYLIILLCIITVGIISCQKESSPTADRDKFLGTWSVTADGSVNGHRTWEMTIKAGASSAEQILIDNFDQNKEVTIGDISGNNFSISSQRVGSDIVQGSGTYSGGKLSFHYTSNDGLETNDVSATATKK